jgi:hypothetical protein
LPNVFVKFGLVGEGIGLYALLLRSSLNVVWLLDGLLLPPQPKNEPSFALGDLGSGLSVFRKVEASNAAPRAGSGSGLRFGGVGFVENIDMAVASDMVFPAESSPPP